MNETITIVVSLIGLVVCFIGYQMLVLEQALEKIATVLAIELIEEAYMDDDDYDGSEPIRLKH